MDGFVFYKIDFEHLQLTAVQTSKNWETEENESSTLLSYLRQT